MQYMLMDYVQEEGWHALTKVEQEHWLGAYRSYMEAMASSGGACGGKIAFSGCQEIRYRVLLSPVKAGSGLPEFSPR